MCTDPKALELYPYRRVDYAAMAQEAASWLYENLHADKPFHDGTFKSWREERSASHPYHYRDGVTIAVAETDLLAHDLFTTQVNASPVPPSEQLDE